MARIKLKDFGVDQWISSELYVVGAVERSPFY